MTIDEILNKLKCNTDKTSDITKKVKIRSEVSQISSRVTNYENDLVSFLTREMSFIVNSLRYEYQCGPRSDCDVKLPELSEEEKIQLIKILKSSFMKMLDNVKETADEIFADITDDVEAEKKETKETEKPEVKEVEVSIIPQQDAYPKPPIFNY